MEIRAVQEEIQQRIEVFCCYARKDQALFKELKNHLTPLEREGLITLWADTDINAGGEWEKEIHLHLNTSHIILLLVSPDFIASDYCYSKEMQRAMQRHEVGEARVIPIILRPVDWKGTPFGEIQALPTNAKPVTNWDNHDEAFLTIAQGIRVAIDKQKSEPLIGTIQIPRIPPTRPTKSRHPRSPLMVAVVFLLVVSVVLFVSLSFSLLRQKSPSIPVTPVSSLSLSPGDCPSTGTARAAVMKPLLLSSASNIVYIINEGIDGNTPRSILERYNVKADSKTEILNLTNTIITQAQISGDGQWILFTTREKSGWFRLGMIRIDGHYLQTLYCTPLSDDISHVRWSRDQKWIIFDNVGYDGPITMYLFNVTNGVLQSELSSSRDWDCWFYYPFAWLNKTQVYLLYGLVGCVPYGGPSITKVALLDINNGANQSEKNLSTVAKISDQMSIASSPERGELFIADGSTISTGDRIIYSSSTFAINQIRVISSTTLLLHVFENTNNTFQSEFWTINMDGSHLKFLTNEDTVDGASLNYFTQDTWSNTSRDGSMYALKGTNQDFHDALFFGFMTGGPPTVFDSAPSETDLAIVGWTTI